MTTADTMCGDDSSLASQCLAFCQALASQGKAFSFSLKINSSFSFSLDTRGGNALAPKTRKKISPSTQRRNARRRNEFLKKKQDSILSVNASSPTPGATSTSSTSATSSTSLQSIATLEANMSSGKDDSGLGSVILPNGLKVPLGHPSIPSCPHTYKDESTGLFTCSIGLSCPMNHPHICIFDKGPDCSLGCPPWI